VGQCSQVGADWLSGEEAQPAAALAASVGQKLYAVTGQSPADAPPSCAALSTHHHAVKSYISN